MNAVIESQGIGRKLLKNVYIFIMKSLGSFHPAELMRL